MASSLNPHQLATLVRWLADARADSDPLWEALVARADELSPKDAAAALQAHALRPAARPDVLGALEDRVAKSGGNLSAVTLAATLKACSMVGPCKSPTPSPPPLSLKPALLFSLLPALSST